MNEQMKELTDGLTEGFDKIASAFDIPEELHEEAKAALTAEVEHLCKEAGFFNNAISGGAQMLGSMVPSGVVGGAGALLGAGAAVAGVSLASNAISGLASAAINKIGKSYSAGNNRQAYEAAFREAVANSDLLQQDPAKARKMGETIFRVAPTISGDANLLTNILNNSIHGDSMDLQTVKVLTELEEKHTKNRNM
jgi:hypothetical protein